MQKLILATRQSPLALAQAGQVAAHLGARLGREIELRTFMTTGDRQAEWSLTEKGGKGLFTSELEQAVARGEADAAVHSAKDLPGEPSSDLIVAGYLPRADPRDVLVRRAGVEKPARIATGSPRRRLQAEFLFPDAAFCEIRGNVETRLRKIAEPGLADATLLAAAGLERLGIGSWPGLEFDPIDCGQMAPAVGQGAIAVQCRPADAAAFAAVLDPETARAVTLERAFQALLGGGCQTAFGVHAATDTLYFFHEATGLRVRPLAPEDFAAPDRTARALLRDLGLLSG